MQKERKCRIVLQSCILILVIVCFTLPVYAADSNLKLQFDNLTLMDNGKGAKWERINQNEHVVLNTNTTGLEEGYYTSQLSAKAKMDWSSYGEISFYVKNLSNKLVKINLFVILEDGTYLTVDDDEFVLMQKGQEQNMNIVRPEDGLFELNNDFDGTVHISFQSFKVEAQDLKKVVSFGINTTTEEDVIQNIEFGDFELISFNNLSVPKDFLSLEIIGDKNVIKPTAGESIEQYSLMINNSQESKNKVSFYLEEETEGVSITEDGRLVVLTNANAEKINIKASINNKFNVIFQVALSESLILNMKDKEGFGLAVPKADEVKKVISSQDIFNRTDVLIIVRITIILISIAILTLYFIWRIKWKKS